MLTTLKQEFTYYKVQFGRCVMPKASLKKLPKFRGIELVGVEQVDEALEALLG